jgi:cytoskeleton protein RodZ
MNESVLAPVSGLGSDSQLTAGEILKNARQAAGVHIEALAVALKVPVSKLEALESNNLELLPDTVFLRALASSVCRTLKLDPAPVLELLPKSKSPRLVPEKADINTPVKTGAGKAFVQSRGSKHSPWLMGCVLLLLASSAVVFFWPSNLQPLDLARFTATGTAKGAEKEVAAQQPELPVEAASRPSVAEPQAPSIAPAQSTPVVEAPPAVPVASVSQPEGEAVSSSLLLLRTRGESWVQVKDATGRVVFEKKMGSGDSAPVSGALPLSVVVGRADVTDVFVRGKPFELNALSRENVARFEVKP